MRTGPVARAAAALLPILLVLVLAEVVVRVTGLSSTNYRTLHRGRVVKKRPGASYVNLKENRNTVRLNNHGFHDRDWLDDGDDAYDILFLGDSMTEGIQVPVDSLFTSHLEDMMVADGLDAHVMNAAVSATGTGHQYLLWDTYVRDSGVDVDHIVLCFFPQNDLKDNHVDLGKSPESFGVYLGRDGSPWVHRDETRLRALARKATRHSALLYLIYQRLHYLTRDAGMKGEDGRRDARNAAFADAQADSVWADSMRRTLRLIGRWSEEARSQGVGFSVAIIPNTDENNFYENEVSRRILAEADTSAYDAMALEVGGRDPYETNSFDGETLGHLNYLGHRLVADELFEWLRPRVERQMEGGLEPDAGMTAAQGGDGER